MPTCPRLDLSGTRVAGLHGKGLEVDGDLLLKDLRCAGSDEHGTVRLPAARIHGQVNLSSAELTNETGPALNADGLRIDSDLFLRDEFKATCSGRLGTVRLLGAHVHGQFDLSGAELTNDAGPALHADRLEVDGNLLLRNAPL